MLIGRTRSAATETVTVTEPTLEDARAALDAACPPGMTLINFRSVMAASATVPVEATGTFGADSGGDEIEADDYEALRAKIPDGHILLSYRTV